MSYFCVNCDPKNIHFKSHSHKGYGKFVRKNHTIQNPNLYDVDKINNDYILNHNKKFDLYLVQADFKTELDRDLNAHITTDYTLNLLHNNLKHQLSSQINSLTSKSYKFYHITERNIKTINDKFSMSYEHYINQPMQAVEMKLNMSIAKNPNLINPLNRFQNHPVIRKFSPIVLRN